MEGRYGGRGPLMEGGMGAVNRVEVWAVACRGRLM